MFSQNPKAPYLVSAVGATIGIGREQRAPGRPYDRPCSEMRGFAIFP